jgi:hypothetical protein
MGMRSKAATSQAAFIRIASLWRTAAAPANASNRGKADQKALNLGCRHPSLHRSTLERGKNMPGEMTITTASDRRSAAKAGVMNRSEMAHLCA